MSGFEPEMPVPKTGMIAVSLHSDAIFKNHFPKTEMLAVSLYSENQQNTKPVYHKKTKLQFPKTLHRKLENNDEREEA